MPHRHLLFYKPFHVLSQFTNDSPTPRRTLAEYIDVKNVYPVGRLDFDSEGLLLLTDDGALQHRLSDPRFGHERTYWVQVEGSIEKPALTALARGVVFQGYRSLPATAHLIEEPAIAPRDPPIRVRQSIPTSWIALTLREGRNRQVRRMTAGVGFPTLRLIRVAIGGLTLGALKPGMWRDVLNSELRAIPPTRTVG